MCRLLGWTGTAPRTAADALGPTAFEAFVDLGHFHRDGWGVAWWPEGPLPPSPSVRHATTAAGEDPEFRRLGEELATDAGIVHLRWATPGMPIVAANCHPFVRADVAMAHNGGIYPHERLGEILPPTWEARLEGNTDSERYLLSVLAEVSGLAGVDGRGGSFTAALAGTVRRLCSGWSPSSLNAVCLTPDALIAVCVYDPDIPQAQLPEPPKIYYPLHWRADQDGVAVASSGFVQRPEDGWSALPNMTMLIAPRTGEAPRTVPIDAPVPGQRSSATGASSATSRLR